MTAFLPPPLLALSALAASLPAPPPGAASTALSLPTALPLPSATAASPAAFGSPLEPRERAFGANGATSTAYHGAYQTPSSPLLRRRLVRRRALQRLQQRRKVRCVDRAGSPRACAWRHAPPACSVCAVVRRRRRRAQRQVPGAAAAARSTARRGERGGVGGCEPSLPRASKEAPRARKNPSGSLNQFFAPPRKRRGAA